MNKSVDCSYSCQLFRPSYGYDLPSDLLNRVCRRSIRVLVMWRLDTIGILSIDKLYLQLQMCFWCTFNLLDLFYLELSNFEDEILLKEGKNVTPGFSNSESRIQDDNFMNSWAVFDWFYRLTFQIGRFLLYLFYENYGF